MYCTDHADQHTKFQSPVTEHFKVMAVDEPTTYICKSSKGYNLAMRVLIVLAIGMHHFPSIFYNPTKLHQTIMDIQLWMEILPAFCKSKGYNSSGSL